MRKLILAGALAFGLILNTSAYGAETERSRPLIPEELGDAWERLQRALQEWSGQLRERFGGRDSRDDRPTISLILKYKDYLRLTPEQVTKLEQLRDNYQRQSIRTDADSRIIDLDITTLLDKPNVEVPKVEQKIREVEKLRADLRIARVRAVEQAKALLTAEQRKKFYETLEPRPPRAGQNPSSRNENNLPRSLSAFGSSHSAWKLKSPVSQEIVCLTSVTACREPVTRAAFACPK